MLTASAASTSARPTLPTPDRWHRPLLWLAAAMAVLTLVTIVLAIVDPQQILGQNAWFKPMKFAISIAIYSVTLAWMLGQVRRWRRIADVAGTISVIGLVVEIVIIIGVAASGTTSHFNISTPLSSGLWIAMGTSIAVVWVAALVVGILLSMRSLGDAARDVAVRAGVVIGLAGMAVAFLMTGPTEAQLESFEGIAGAHAVGVPDGGAGLPFLGWSLEGGDLRAPHFIGMHALQALPLLMLGLEALATRVPVLRPVRVRAWLVGIASAAYAALLVIITLQALAGEPIVAPTAPTVAATVAVAGAAVAAATVVLVRARRR